MELVIQPFPIQPLINLRDGPAELRWFYNRPFLDSAGTQVQNGNGTQGFYVPVPCTISSGLVQVVQDSMLWTTDDAQDPAPLTIFVSASLFTSRGALITHLTIAGKSQWVVPSSLAPTTQWQAFSTYNQAVALYYYNPTFYNAPQTDRRIEQEFQVHFASDTTLGLVFLSIPPDIATFPAAWGINDPLVRDAIFIDGIAVGGAAPSDGQVLTYIAANNDIEWANAGGGSGNVISNEVASVDTQLFVAAGTGGKTIKLVSSTGYATLVNGVLTMVTPSGLEIPTGAVNGTNPTFVVANLPIEDGSFKFYINGTLQQEFAGAAGTQTYTRVGATVTSNFPPQGDGVNNDWVVCDYWY